MSEDIKLSELELECLMALNQLRTWNEDWLYTYSRVKDYLKDDPPIKYLKKAFKALREKGLIRYSVCCDEEEGYPSGSGHGIELKGINYLKSIGKNLV